jgi:hypothetical protein
LISRAGALEPSQHLSIEPQRHKLLGIVGFGAPALNEFIAAVDVGSLKKNRLSIREFRHIRAVE